MSQYWTLEEAQQQFEDVVDRAMAGEPQAIMRDGQEVVVVTAKEGKHERTQPKGKLSGLFTELPFGGVDLDPRRCKD